MTASADAPSPTTLLLFTGLEAASLDVASASGPLLSSTSPALLDSLVFEPATTCDERVCNGSHNRRKWDNTNT